MTHLLGRRWCWHPRGRRRRTLRRGCWTWAWGCRWVRPPGRWPRWPRWSPRWRSWPRIPPWCELRLAGCAAFCRVRLRCAGRRSENRTQKREHNGGGGRPGRRTLLGRALRTLFTSNAGCLACVYGLPSARQHAPLPAITSGPCGRQFCSHRKCRVAVTAMLFATRALRCVKTRFKIIQINIFVSIIPLRPF